MSDWTAITDMSRHFLAMPPAVFRTDLYRFHCWLVLFAFIYASIVASMDISIVMPHWLYENNTLSHNHRFGRF